VTAKAVQAMQAVPVVQLAPAMPSFAVATKPGAINVGGAVKYTLFAMADRCNAVVDARVSLDSKQQI
jgi:hypothetical protein